MSLNLYNTLSRKKEPFSPIDAANVRMYVCGPTVYDFAHIGNARPVIVFDVLFRLLKHLASQGEWDGGIGQTEVTYVRNITDVDDKINQQSIESGRGIQEITEETIKLFHETCSYFGTLKPTKEPRVTQSMPEIMAMIQTLLDKGFAYQKDGHVLYRVSSFKDYGNLSRKNQDELLAGARVEVAPYKENPEDFVLWKPSKPGEPYWQSPFGVGRPGTFGIAKLQANRENILYVDAMSSYNPSWLTRLRLDCFSNWRSSKRHFS